jgi:hypothetical protein
VRVLKVLLFLIFILGGVAAMGNENKFDSGVGHVILPVRVGDETHSIAVPPDTDLGDLHSALLDHMGINPSELPQKQPTKEGSLEYSEPFRQAAAKTWEAAGNGRMSREAGFALDKDWNAGPIQSHDRSAGDKNGSLAIKVEPDSMGTLHTHEDIGNDQPSETDIQAAKKSKTQMYVVSRTGLWSVDGRNGGKVTQVFSNPNWLNPKKKK